ncbi:MAG: S9 family peptidase, partial [Candidatus Aminicenantes bacterium]|nr:S9 family peptidase [Candidatus Aminicenantes bacterium]
KDTIEKSMEKEKKIEDSGVDVKVLNSLMYRVWNSWKDGKRSHIFLADKTGKTGKDLTPGNFDTPPLDLGGKKDFTFSPDGKVFAFVKNTDEMVAISTNNDIFIKKSGSDEEKNITEQNRGSDVNPVFSPKGEKLAYVSMKREGFEADKHNIILYDLKSGKRNNLTSGFKYSVNEFIFSPGGSYIYFTASESIFVPVFRLRIRDKRVDKIAGNIYASDLNITANGKYLVFLNQSVSSPRDVFKVRIRGRKISRVTSFNKEVFEGIEMNPVERFVFTGAGNEKVEGLLIKPPFFDPEKKYPMVFLIHGGPQGAWGDDFHYRWNMSLFASPGYIVAAINFHGSRGYGQNFTDAVSKDWGGAPFIDMVKGQQYLIENYKFIDENKIVAAGASYGGFMINWIAGNYDQFKYPFKCLVSHDGIFDSRSMYYSTEELWFEEWEYGGTPWNSDLYEKFNPARFVEKFKIPMLIIHGEKDFRVPVSQGIMLFTAHQRRGIKSKMLYFPNEDHFVQKPKNAQFWWSSVFKWFEENIK